MPVDRAEDLNWLRDTLQDFVVKTGSALAQRLLSDWPASAKLFVKVRLVGNQFVSCLEFCSTLKWLIYIYVISVFSCYEDVDCNIFCKLMKQIEELAWNGISE